MARRFEAYAVKRNDNLGDPDFWNKRFEDIDLRIAARELDGDKIAGAVDELTSVALARLNDTFTPVVSEAIERLNSVGALFSSTSDSTVTIGAGFKTFLLDESTRAGFVVPEFVGVRPAGLSDRGLIAQVTAYDRVTGLLDVEVVLFSGAGTYDDWVIRITGAPDVDHSTRIDNPHETTAAQVGAYTVAQANTAIGNAVAGAVAAEATARDSAIGAAISALKGGVSTAYDTLIEIATKITDNDSVVGGIITSLGNRLRFDAAQALTFGQQKQALANLGSWEAGDAKLTFRSVASPGWFICDDGTIGDASSGATTRANADTADAYAVFWGIAACTLQDSAGVAIGSKGASAAADYALHRRLVIPKTLGRAIAIAGAGSGLTSRVLGATAGSETETPTISKTAAHTHSIFLAAMNSAPPDLASVNTPSGASSGAGVAGGTTTGSQGGGAALNIIPPEFFVKIAIKL
ncbi:hypothetical protein ONR75_11230 [Rhodopseudomonas sp. P2A-2r]|uniref:hypothetical protein n=1 Tax=Rhodopseudomonas sp. P2A-2r TaxID=2991972 RepID=UPI002234420E|nr:hypothetical protein [Rhodopseudomonas sp. P2A-2r]UZE51129.1 hypothetical protein ONR75_11230 [Rhodopseudomonas sp. P2A-2r]